MKSPALPYRHIHLDFLEWGRGLQSPGRRFIEINSQEWIFWGWELMRWILRLLLVISWHLQCNSNRNVHSSSWYFAFTWWIAGIASFRKTKPLHSQDYEKNVTRKIICKLFVHPFSKYLGMAYCVPGKFLSPGNTVLSKTSIVPAN